VNQVLREVIADALERLADHDERLGLVTVTSVDTAPDLQRATVYVSSLPDDAMVVLKAQRIELQRVIAREVRMKRTPHLDFEPDPAVAHGWRVEEILRELRRTGDAPAGPDDASDDRE
jgi:ribosome-binding factor A